MNKSLLRLVAGFRKFKEKYFYEQDWEKSIYSRLSSTGQTPKTLLIGCSDSRVDPAILTGAAPGELFVVRNVANLVPPCEPSAVGFHGTSSAIEFAVTGLKVENIVILGHRQCGGIRSLVRDDPEKSESFVGHWMSIASSARKKVLADHPHSDEDTKCRAAETEAIKVSIQNLKTFPFVTEAMQSRGLTIVGVYFDLEHGQLWQYNESTNQFEIVSL